MMNDYRALLVKAESGTDAFTVLGNAVRQMQRDGAEPLYCQVGRYVNLPVSCLEFYGVPRVPALGLSDWHIRVVGAIIKEGMG
jgi:hypothetical protein